VMSISAYCARPPSDQSLIQYELRDGVCYVDPRLFPDRSNITDEQRFGHRVYAVVAPDIPGFMGGGARFFDGSLGGDSVGMKVDALSPDDHQRLRPGVLA